MKRLAIWLVPSQLILVPVISGCEEEKPPAPKQEPAAAVSALEPATPPATEAEPKLPPEPTRPKNIDTELTSARRAAVEQAVSEAKGFVVAGEIESKLKQDKKVSEEGSATKAFDRAARGKWVLFTGPVVNLTETGFDMAITYTPVMPGDTMGMSRQFFMVTFSDIKGYEKLKFKAGTKAVVLAQYVGKKKAEGGHELVAEGVWK